MNKLCQHNFENNRQPKAFENYAGIIGHELQFCACALRKTHMEQGDGAAGPAKDVQSLLEQLRSPASSTLARKRKVTKNTTLTGTKKGKGAVAAEPQSISPATRVKEFPEESLCVSHGKLFCRACRETLSVKKSVVTQHIRSAKHSRGKDSVAKREKRERDISDMLKRYDKEVHPVGESLPDDVRVHRVKVVLAFMKAGIPLAKIDFLREILEENSHRLSSSQNLRQLVPFVQKQEQMAIKSEIEGKHLSVIFDGTTHVCEAMVVVVRFIDEQWQPRQRVARLMLLAKSPTGEEVARQLIICLSTELGVTSSQLVAAMRTAPC